MRPAVWLGVLLALLAVLSACQSAPGPALVQVTGAASTRLREGDVLELRGDSFPEGRPAEVTLQGEIARPGLPLVRGFRVSIAGRSVSKHAVAVDVTRPLSRTFSGTTEPAHATFHGSIEVSFAPRVRGTPPVTGILPDVRLDFIPAEGDLAALEARRDDALKFATFIGVLLSESDSPTVSGVMPGSPAERAGVLLGDRLVALAGVNVLAADDLSPPPRARAVELVAERGGSERRRLLLDIGGFRPVSARELGLAAGMVTGALALLLLLASPFGRALSFVELRLSQRLGRSVRRDAPVGSSAPRPASMLTRLVRLLPTGVGTYATFVAVSALLSALCLGTPLVARELDVPALVVLSFTALSLTSLVFGAPGERGLWARARRAVLVLVQALPALSALGCLGLLVGSFGAEALALEQGALPWQWLAFRGPLLFGAALLFFLSLVPEASRGRSLETVLGNARPTLLRPHAGTALAGQAQLLLGCGVLSLVFFGGARVPGVEPALTPSFGVALAGVLLLLVKAWTLAALVTGLRWVLGRVDIDEVSGLTLRFGLPASALLLGLSFIARQAPFERLLALGDRGLAWVCLAGWLVLAVVVARRVVPGRVALEGERGPNPWL